jgi:calcium-dependent protein kinase
MVMTELTLRGPEPHPIIIDFGLSKLFMFGERSEQRVGSLLYSSPEMLLQGFSHSIAADMWSMGVILYIMLGGYFPFISNPPTEEGITYLIVRGQFSLRGSGFS